MKQEASIALFHYWNHLRGTRLAPKQTEIEPAQIKSLLADSLILERDSRGEAIFRLAGTRLCATYGRELKGYSFPLLWALRDQRMIARLVQSAFQDRMVVVVNFEGISMGRRTTFFEMILLPLEGGLANSRCLGSISLGRKPFWLGSDPIVENRVDSIRVIDADREQDYHNDSSYLSVPPLAPDTASRLDDVTGLREPGRRIRHLVVFDGGRNE